MISNTNENTMLSDFDFQLFGEDKHFRLFDKLGAHLVTHNGINGAQFAVWAPNAASVSVIGDFNRWDTNAHPLATRSSTGLWDGFVPGAVERSQYKYHVVGQNGHRMDKSDPYAFSSQVRPETASLVVDLQYTWNDSEWMQGRSARHKLSSPISIYEMHFGSWRQNPAGPNRFYSYRELAPMLAQYLTEHGFTHVEFLPLMEHPFYGSWGYQTTGYFAPTSCYGSPQELMFLIDTLHQNGFGIILDWVPSHFPCDGHGLGYFDGTHLYEHADPKEGFHPEWKSSIFNYGRPEVANFLINSALFWLEKYHVDGIRVDAVASMLYRDYSRKAGEWVPNRNGGRENLEAIAFLKLLNEKIYDGFPDVQTFAEESTAWPGVTKPTYDGGLGFGLKWDMGWMHDTLKYMALDPIFRKHSHGQIIFRSVYANSENYVLSLSHDEVVYGKKSLLKQMPGNTTEQFANLRLLYGYMFTQPGKKLLFMGAEFGQAKEWYHESGLEWELLANPANAGMARWVGDLNRIYRTESALHANDCDPKGFRWIEANDWEQSVFCYLREGTHCRPVLVALNFTPVARHNYRIGVPCPGQWEEILNSDAEIYGGAKVENFGAVETVPMPSHGERHSVTISIPPLGMVLLSPTESAEYSQLSRRK